MFLTQEKSTRMRNVLNIEQMEKFLVTIELVRLQDTLLLIRILALVGILHWNIISIHASLF